MSDWLKRELQGTRLHHLFSFLASGGGTILVRKPGYKPIAEVNGYEPCYYCQMILEAHPNDECSKWRP